MTTSAVLCEETSARGEDKKQSYMSLNVLLLKEQFARTEVRVKLFAANSSANCSYT